MCLIIYSRMVVTKFYYYNQRNSQILLTAARLAPSVERLTAEREVAGSILGAGPILKFLKQLRNEGTPFALQAARPSRD